MGSRGQQRRYDREADACARGAIKENRFISDFLTQDVNDVKKHYGDMFTASVKVVTTKIGEGSLLLRLVARGFIRCIGHRSLRGLL